VRILVTGATGFAGGWLMRELDAAGHAAIAAPPHGQLDITDGPRVAEHVNRIGPDAIAHLAGMAFGPDARRDPAAAMAVNAGGTRAILAAGAAIDPELPVLVVSSSEVYGRPDPRDLPLAETAATRSDQPYGRSKIAVEEEARAAASRDGRRIAIVRPFNHTGPGQRLEFVVPALAARVIGARAAGRRTIVAGNLDVRRDFSDVRDVVRAYRLVLEALAAGSLAAGPQPVVLNIASGRSQAIRDIAAAFGRLAGIDLAVTVDPDLVRGDDPPEIRGDASRLTAELGWQPAIPIEDTLRDVYGDIADRLATPG
jgi:GDP-4-dehydro-6-deoxy-D-mannose reductase